MSSAAEPRFLLARRETMRFTSAPKIKDKDTSETSHACRSFSKRIENPIRGTEVKEPARFQTLQRR
jgi:hypothetical protein